MAAKEKGKIVSASPDSPTLEKLSTFSQQIRSALHCFSAVATRTNALWQSDESCILRRQHAVATRTNALWQRSAPINTVPRTSSRNPHECAVAKNSHFQQPFYRDCRNPHECAVAKNWKREHSRDNAVATRTNALWQSAVTASTATAAAGRNPHECAVAKSVRILPNSALLKSQPARMRCGKDAVWKFQSLLPVSQPARMRCGKDTNPPECILRKSRNPHECAVAKGQPVLPDQRIRVATRRNALWQSYVQHDDGSVVLVATRTNALWQSRCCKPRRTAIQSRNPRECAVAKTEVTTANVGIRVATRTNALWQRSAENGA